MEKNLVPETQFGRLTVIEYIGLRRSGFSSRARQVVKCRCACGKTVTVRLDSLQRGMTQSCGCLSRERAGAAAKGVNRSKVVVGNKYGSLTVLKRLPNNTRGAAVYRCLCGCGNVRTVLGAKLSGDQAKKCRKCGYVEHLDKLHENNRKPRGEAACYGSFLNTKRTCADSRKLAWQINYADWKCLTRLPCQYCGCQPSNYYKGQGNGGYAYNGLDRVNNDVGYLLENVVPCCKRCNHAKSDQTVEEFLTWASQIHRLNTKA